MLFESFPDGNLNRIPVFDGMWNEGVGQCQDQLPRSIQLPIHRDRRNHQFRGANYLSSHSSGGIYLLNEYPQSNLQLTVGVSYSFVIRNTDQALFSLTFGTAINSPFLSNTAITVAVGSYATRFTLHFNVQFGLSLI